MPLFNPGILATGGSVTGDLTVTGNLVADGTTAAVGALTTSAGIADTGDVGVTSGNVLLNTLGKSLRVKEGSNACMGTGVLNGTTEVVISTTAVTANSRIFLTSNTVGGTPLGVIYVSSRTAGTSFGVKGAATDTSTFAWLLVEPA